MEKKADHKAAEHKAEHKAEEHKPVGQRTVQMGRIVIYNNTSPAIIQHVNEDGTCRLFIFDDRGYNIVPSAAQGDGEGKWAFPVIIQGKG